MFLGLTHVIFLPEEAVVVEMFPYNWKYHVIRSLAKYSGKTYMSWQNTHKENHFPDDVGFGNDFDKHGHTIVDVCIFFKFRIFF